MHVGVITYQRSHLKTLQVVTKLLAKSYSVTLYAFPFKDRPAKKGADKDSPTFSERPPQLINFDLRAFCLRYGVGFVSMEGWEDEHAPTMGEGNPDIYLTCIAKIIPHSFIKDRIILNAHPGLLPINRGVDAFKWAIINEWPIGITLHAINEKIDHGIILKAAKIPVLETDDLSAVAIRAYEYEVDLLTNFTHYLQEVETGLKVSDEFPLSRKRISSKDDENLESIFIEKRSIFIDLSAY